MKIMLEEEFKMLTRGLADSSGATIKDKMMDAMKDLAVKACDEGLSRLTEAGLAWGKTAMTDPRIVESLTRIMGLN